MNLSGRALAVLLLSIMVAGCTATGGRNATPEARRQAIDDMRTEVLGELYGIKPDVRAQIGDSVGYAVFSSANVNLILASFGGGVGVAHDNRDGHDTYMKMGEVGVGLGAGVKDFRAVFVFHDGAALDRFVNEGWAIGGQADAAAKAGDLGAAVSGEAIIDNVSIYQMTQSGLALQATIKGTRYWQDRELNQ